MLRLAAACLLLGVSQVRRLLLACSALLLSLGFVVLCCAVVHLLHAAARWVRPSACEVASPASQHALSQARGTHARQPKRHDQPVKQ
jgi:hypothetical protein